MNAPTSEKKIRKTVGRPLEELSVFDRIRQLQASLEKTGLQPKQKNYVPVQMNGLVKSGVTENKTF